MTGITNAEVHLWLVGLGTAVWQSAATYFSALCEIGVL